MNSLDARTKANAAIVPAGASGAVNVFVTNTADVIIDGYFTTPSQSTLKFFPLTPCRVADTRDGTYPPGLGLRIWMGAWRAIFRCSTVPVSRLVLMPPPIPSI